MSRGRHLQRHWHRAPLPRRAVSADAPGCRLESRRSLLLLTVLLGKCAAQCTNACVGAPSFGSDGMCDDGGTGSDYPFCEYGTDCTDCGPRASPSPPPPPWTPAGAPSPPPLPPSPPPPPTVYAGSVWKLRAALDNPAIETIVLAPGRYSFANNNGNCDDPYGLQIRWLCITRTVTIQAAEPGAVELDAMGQRGVLGIDASGVQLIGLNITGGLYNYVRACFPNASAPFLTTDGCPAFCSHRGAASTSTMGAR